MPDLERINEVKVILRSLLVAEGSRNVTIQKLNRMYREMEDEWIPYREFNYSNIQEFLYSIPDTLKLYTNRDNEICAYHVETEASAHISSLVARTRSKTKKRSKSTYGYRSHSTNHYNNYNYNARSATRIQMPSLASISQVLDGLREQARKINGVIRKSDVLCKVKEKLGKYSYAMYTIHNLTKQLESLNHKITIEGDLIYFKEDLANKRAAAASYSNNYKSTFNYDHSWNSPSTVVPNNHNSYSAQSKTTNFNDFSVKTNGFNSIPNQPTTPKSSVQNNSVQRQQTTPTSSVPKKPAVSQDYSKFNSTQKQQTTLFSSVPNKPAASQDSNKFNSAQKQQTTTISSVSNKPAASQDSSKFNSVQNNSMILNVSNVVHNDHSKINNNDSSVMNGHVNNIDASDNYKVSKSQDNEQKMKTNGNPVNDVIKERTRIRLEKLIEKHPEGIWCSELPNLYKKEYGIDLEYQESGFNSITEFVAALPDIFEVVEPPNTNRLMVLDARRSINKSESRHQTKSLASVYNYEDYVAHDPEPVPLKLSSKVTRSLIPEGVMSIGETVDQIIVSTLAAEEYIEVCISEIFTPTFFWITLRQNRRKIKDLMNDLGEFYSHRDLDEFTIPQVVLEPGLNVVCLYAKIWHRAIIKKIKPDGFVTVFFYDYGTVKTYNPNDLYFMNKKFSSLPAQAIACSLFNVRPINASEWPISATNKFVNKVWNIPLVAIVASTDEENNTMAITLTDTSDDQIDLHINDWMVENELAEFGKMGKKIPLHKIYLYDEDVLLNQREEDNNRLKKERRRSKASVTDIENNALNVIETRESCISPRPSTSCMDSSIDASSVVHLVKESKELIQQTNTITQAILLNMPVAKAASNENITDNQSKCSDAFKRFEVDLKSNLSSIQLSIPERSNKVDDSEYAQNDLSYYRFHPYERSASAFSSVSQQPQQLPAYSNGYTESKDARLERSSISSSYFDLSVRENNNNNVSWQLSNKSREPEKELDRISDGGTPYFKVVNNDQVQKKSSTINIMYPTEFAKQLNGNPVDINISANEKHEKSIHREEVDEGYSTAMHSTSRTTSNLSAPVPCSVAQNPCVSTVVYLSEKCDRKPMHIFHINNEGWVCANEIVDAFTNLKDQRVMFKLLQILQHEVNFKHLTRETDRPLFFQLDQSKLKVPRDKNNKIVEDYVLVIMPLKTVLQALVKLDFLNAKMLKEAIPLMKQCKENAEEILFETFNSKILYDVLNLPVQYGQFKRLLRSSNK